MNAPDGDIRWTAVLSADMVDFTANAQRIGAEQVYGLLSHVLSLATDIIEAEGGRVVDTAGDGILASFGAPKALENASLRCCRAAATIHKRLAEQQTSLSRRFDVIPQFRIGISGGNALVVRSGRDTFKLVGDPVNEAARLQAACVPGEVLLSEAIQRETTGLVNTSDRGPLEAKGFDAPIHAYQLNGLVETTTQFDGHRRRGLTDLVSRQAELTLARQALDEGNSIITITGPPGIGKSRLLHEIMVTQKGGYRAYIGQCAPTGRTSAYGPFLDILRQAGGAPWGADRSAILGAFFAHHPGLRDADAAAQFLEPVEQRRDQTDRALADRAFLLSLLRGLQEREHCILAVEDVHWIDASTQALATSMAEANLSLVVTSRPEPSVDWLAGPQTVRIDLNPLDGEQIRRIAEGRLGGSISPDLAHLISQKAEGNPLIAEEIVRALQQANQVSQNAQRFDLVGSGDALLTGNLEHLVLSRFDRLPPDQKTTLQYAAAIGRDFSEDLLNSALERSAALSDIAEQAELVEPVEAGHWRFSHALVRDAVYKSLLTAQRHSVHDRIAGALQTAGSESLGNADVVAEHLLQTDRPDRAVPHLVRAAADSLRAYALYDVDRQLEDAMGFLETDPSLLDEEEFRNLAVYWLRALDQIGDFGRVERVAKRVLPRLARDGYSPQLAIARTLTALAMTHSRDYRGAEDLALATLETAEPEGDAWGAAWAKVALMRIYDETAWKGYEEVERLAAEIAPVAERTGDRHLGMTALYLMSSAYRSSGYGKRALAVVERLETFSERDNDRRAAAYAMWARALVHVVQGNPELAQRTISQALVEAVPGLADERVAACIDLFAQTFLEAPDGVRPKLLKMTDETRALKDYNLAHSMEWLRAILEIKSGHLALGWGLMNQLQVEVIKAGNKNLIRQVYISKAEILLTIAGLIKPADEAPPDRPIHPRAKPGLRDIALGLWLKLRAKPMAEKMLHTGLELDPAKHGSNYARCLIDLGLIAASRSKTKQAKDYLNAGLESALAEDLHLLAERAKTALDRN